MYAMEKSRFEKQLNAFGEGVHESTQFFYTYLTLQKLVVERLDLRPMVSSTGLFMRTVLGSLRSSTFISIHKLFDKDSKGSVSGLLNAAKADLGVFDPASLVARKRDSIYGKSPDWLERVVNDMWVPSLADFIKLDPVVAKWTGICNTKVTSARHKWYGHRDFFTDIEARLTLPETDVDDLEGLLAFSNNLRDSFTDLFFNGRRIELKDLESPSREFLDNSPQSRATAAVRLFFDQIA